MVSVPSSQVARAFGKTMPPAAHMMRTHVFDDAAQATPIVRMPSFAHGYTMINRIDESGREACVRVNYYIDFVNPNLDSCEILSLSFGAKVITPAGYADTKDPYQDVDLSVTKVTDKVSMDLMRFCANGGAFGLVTVRAVDNTGKLYMTYSLPNAIVKSFQTGGSGGEGPPTENITFHTDGKVIFQPAPPP